MNEADVESVACDSEIQLERCRSWMQNANIMNRAYAYAAQTPVV